MLVYFQGFNLGLGKQASFLFCLCLFLCHIFIGEGMNIEEHTSLLVITIFYKLCTLMQYFSPWENVLSWVHWEESLRWGFRCPWTRVWGSRKRQRGGEGPRGCWEVEVSMMFAWSRLTRLGSEPVLLFWISRLVLIHTSGWEPLPGMVYMYFIFYFLKKIITSNSFPTKLLFLNF